MAASRVVIWLHGLGDSGPANQGIASFFTSPEFADFKWRFPSAPNQPVSCNGRMRMPSWFDLPEIPIVPESPNVEEDVLKAVRSVHEMIDREVAAGISADCIFLCGFSQGGALALASSMLYPKTLAGAAVFSGWVALDKESFAAKITSAAKQTPVLWQHGLDDKVVEFSAGQAGPPFLARADVKCEFQAIPDLVHSIDAEELSTLKRWMKERL